MCRTDLPDALRQPRAVRLHSIDGTTEYVRHLNPRGEEGCWPTTALPYGIRLPYTKHMDLLGRITVDPNVRFGKPCVRGTRITVGDVLGYLAGGMSEDQLLTEFPQLTCEDIRACFAYAAERERRTLAIPAA